MSYKASLNMKCAKQHTCVQCGGKYSYVFTRYVEAQGETEKAASDAAEQAVAESMNKSIDTHECPHCGVVQPEMIAEEKGAWYLYGMIAGPAVILLALAIGAASGASIGTCAVLASLGALASVGLFAKGVYYHPNKDLDYNLEKSANKVVSQALSKDDPPTSRDYRYENPPGGEKPIIGWFGLGLAVFALVLTFAPIFFSVLNGLDARNKTYPAIVGPGDTVRVYFKDKINSVKGMWQGTVSVRVNNDEFRSLPGFKGTTKSNSWGDEISGKSVNNSSNKMYIDLTIPNKPELAGKTLDLNLRVNARFPYRMGQHFDNSTKNFKHDLALHLSAPRAGSTYNNLWSLGEWSALILIIVGGILLGLANEPFSSNPSQTQVVFLGAA